MKWFKHLSTARNDEKIARLEDECGLEGYGFYFKILEIVAETINEENKFEVTYSLTRWSKLVNTSTRKWVRFTQACVEQDLIFCKTNEELLQNYCKTNSKLLQNYCKTPNKLITISIPKLLKHRDNHTKNLQAACKQELEEYKEEKEKERDIKTSCADPKKTGSTQQPEKETKSHSGIAGKATSKTTEASQAEGITADTATADAVINLPLNATGTYHAVTQGDIDKWAQLYPAVDVIQDLRAMIGWLDAKPERKKTKTGIKTFINSWLAKSQNSARAFPPNHHQQSRASNEANQRPYPPSRREHHTTISEYSEQMHNEAVAEALANGTL